VVDLPPVTYLRRELDWAPGQRSVYLKMLNDHVVEFADHWLEADEIGPRLTRLHQILTNPQQLGLDCDSTRWTVLDDDLESIGIAQHKVVVFAHYRASIKRLNARYSHLNPAVIFGGTADVDAQKSKFNEDPTCRIMFAHPKSAGLGINLSVANYCIFFEYSYDLDDYDQAVSRLDRPGQKSNVTVINYGVRGSMELNRILPALISKKQLSMALLRDPVEFMKFASITDEEE
jgi:SNF2 family DNA or RNA helicase